MIKTIIAVLLAEFVLSSTPTKASEWQYYVNGTTTVWELHVIKNNGMDTHVKYRTYNMVNAVRELESLKYRHSDMIKRAWIEKKDVKAWLIK